MQSHQHRIHHQSGKHSLENADGDRLCANGLQLAHPELITNGKRDKPQSGLGNDAHSLHLLQGIEAQSGNL